jgi:hypothetical protein
LLAQLHIGALAKKNSVKDVRDALGNLPKKLDDTYDEVMTRILKQDEEDVVLAKSVLAWITYARRPLTVSVLQKALAITPECTQVDPSSYPEEDFMISACAGLVTVDPESTVIRLVHYTTQQYFQRVRDRLFPEAEATIAICCLTYLSLLIQKFKVESLGTGDSLFTYASAYWGTHAQAREDMVQNSILEFIEDKYRRDISIQAKRLVDLSPRWTWSGISRLSLASAFGLKNTVILLLEAGEDIEGKDSEGFTALQYAAMFGQEAVAHHLCEREANLEARDHFGWTPLSNAISNAQYVSGQEQIVQLLLKKGANVNSRNDDNNTPLHLAASTASEAIVRLLLEGGADVNAVGMMYYGTPLQWASSNKNPAVLSLLSEKGGRLESQESKPSQYLTVDGNAASVT